MRLQLPLFPSYVFVRMFLRERVRGLQVPGVARLVGFGERPLALPEQEIEFLRSGLGRGMNAQPHPYLTVGATCELSWAALGAGRRAFAEERRISIDFID